MKPARALALDAMLRIEDGAYANLVVPQLLTTSGLEERDRAFVTQLVYGATRMRRACDWLVDQRVQPKGRTLDTAVRAALRLGTFQLVFLDTPPHAAVSQTVDLVDPAARGFVNAILRKVSVAHRPIKWPNLATELSYPDWMVERLTKDLGADAARAALAIMNEPPTVTERPDGYIQDEASQWVAAYVDAKPGELVADLCAAPGGKSTLMAEAGACVIAADLQPHRAALVVGNARRLGLANVNTVVADAHHSPFSARAFDRILVDAPCSGLGVLRRRPDARWRMTPEDVTELSVLQRRLLDAAVPLLKPGGRLVYSVCTLTSGETAGIDNWLADKHPELKPIPPPGEPWQRVGRGARLLPQTANTDGMFVLGLRRT
jgi:16S rRNA (cytosine967-C5)-methyltransferase